MQAQRRSYPGWPALSDEEVEAAAEVLRSGRINYWTGDQGRSFEREFAEAHSAAHAIALSNGTAALEVALYGVGLQPGDEVVVTPRTFIATASAVVLRGGVPRMADVDRESGNITRATVEAALTPATRGIIPVHLGGWPCDMEPLLELAAERGLFVIEDCAQAIGATYRGRPVGTFGQVGAFSFCQDKIITTGGEGGMVLTDDTAAYERMWAFKDHGKSYDAVFRREHPPGFRWLHESFGTNLRMTEAQSAIGRSALGRLPDHLAARRRNAELLMERLRPLPALRVPIPPDHVVHAWYKLHVYVRPERLGADWSRDRIQAALEELGVPVRMGSCSEIYREKAFQGTGWTPAERLPVARELGETSLMFPVHPTLTEEDMEAMADAVVEVVGRASGG